MKINKTIKFLILLSSFIWTTLAIPYLKPREPDICAAWILASEARGASSLEQRAVLDVLEHRMWVRGLTSCEALREPLQFSGYRKGMEIKVSNEDLTRWFKVSMMPPVVPSAEYFHANYVKPKWTRKLTKIAVIGDSVFYKEKQK